MYVNWTYLVQDRLQLVSSCEHGNQPSDSINVGEFLDQMTLTSEEQLSSTKFTISVLQY
jgi:hypothetical protein